MDAIVYESNAGSTKRYAKMLGTLLNLPVYERKEAKAALLKGTKIIYLGWVMAGKIKGYAEALKVYEISAVCAVGMAETNTKETEIREKNNVSSHVEVFTLQGNFNVDTLHGVFKVMMKTIKKALTKKSNRTEEEQQMFEQMTSENDYVCEENLQSIISWYTYALI